MTGPNFTSDVSNGPPGAFSPIEPSRRQSSGSRPRKRLCQSQQERGSGPILMSCSLFLEEVARVALDYACTLSRCRPASLLTRGRRLQCGPGNGRSAKFASLNCRARNWTTNQTPSTSRYDMRIQGRIVPPASPPNIMPNWRPIGAPVIAARPKRLAPTNVPAASPPMRPITVPRTEQTIIPPMAPGTTGTVPIPPTIAPSPSQTASMRQTRLPIEARVMRLFMVTTTRGKDKRLSAGARSALQTAFLHSRSARRRADICFLSSTLSVPKNHRPCSSRR